MGMQRVSVRKQEGDKIINPAGVSSESTCKATGLSQAAERKCEDAEVRYGTVDAGPVAMDESADGQKAIPVGHVNSEDITELKPTLQVVN